jgi:hypothetical protein
MAASSPIAVDEWPMLGVGLRVATIPGCVGAGDTGKTQRIDTLPIQGLEYPQYKGECGMC